jgi:hypothetical protein
MAMTSGLRKKETKGMDGSWKEEKLATADDRSAGLTEP